MPRRPPISTLFPYTTLFRSLWDSIRRQAEAAKPGERVHEDLPLALRVLRDLSDAGVRSVRVDSSETRSEEHTSELQSRRDLVCRLLLEKKKKSICLLVHVEA